MWTTATRPTPFPSKYVSGASTVILNDHGENRGTDDLLACNRIVEDLGLVPSRDNNSPLHLVRILA